MNTGNQGFDDIVAPLYDPDFSINFFGKKVMPFGGEIEDDGFITVYSSIPIVA